jgi:glycine/D-amino acid oxidase-like deaminating enzyme
VVGLALAFELARRGAETVVFSRGSRSGRGEPAGLVNPQARTGVAPEAVRGLALLSRHVFPAWIESIEEEGGLSCEFDVRGGLLVAVSDAEEVELDRALDWQRARALVFEVLAAEEARAREPALGAAVQAAFAFSEDGQVSPSRLRRGLAFASVQAGALVVTGTPALAVRVEAGRTAGLDTAAGFLRAEAVVNAAGPWAAHLPGAPVLPVTPLRLPVVLLDASSDPDRLTRFVASPAGALVPRRDGGLAVAGLPAPDGFEARLFAAEASRLLSRAIAILPGAARYPLLASWASAAAGSPDGVPLFGETALPGFFLSTGAGMDAVLLAPGAALLVADLLTGMAPPLAPAPFSPARFDV